jgi:RNA polymerase sigma factor (sigma-70 family)
MATASLYGVLCYLRRRAAPGRPGGTDAELLERFAARRDGAAFEALVRRHGPAVLAVCRRILDNAADADDAFQATFLVLVRRPEAVGRHESVGSWLYGVAVRTALRARTDLARRRKHERQVAAMHAADSTPEAAWSDLRPLLDEEVARLPEKYREPFRLCCLEGQSYDDAARALGCSKGTVSSRLTRARERLRRRLAGRGVTLSAGLFAAALAAHAAPAAVPAPLLGATLRAATLVGAGQAAGVVSSRVLQLVEGVQTMSASKFKVVASLVLVVSLVGAVGFAASRLAPGEPPPRRGKTGRPPPRSRAGPPGGSVPAWAAPWGSPATSPSRRTAGPSSPSMPRTCCACGTRRRGRSGRATTSASVTGTTTPCTRRSRRTAGCSCSSAASPTRTGRASGSPK